MSLVPILFGSKTAAAGDPWDDPFSGTLVSISGTGACMKPHNNVVQVVDWKEIPTSHVFKADLPPAGLKKVDEAVKVEVENGVLTVPRDIKDKKPQARAIRIEG